MFQAIEAQDPGHQCIEYWNNKKLVSATSSGTANGDNIQFLDGPSVPLDDGDTKVFGVDLTKEDEDNNELIAGNYHSFEAMKSILEGLLKRASPAELSTMHRLLGSDRQSAQWRLAFAALIEKIQKSL